jgi:hypothetical protein
VDQCADHPSEDQQNQDRGRKRNQAETGIARPGYARGFGSDGEGRRIVQADIGQKTAPEGQKIGRNSHPSSATNITVLQSFCDSRARRPSASFNTLILLDFLWPGGFAPQADCG